MTRFVGTPLRGTEFANAGDEAISARVGTDSYPRVRIDAGGRITWSSGAATGDVTLYRSDVNVLKTDDTVATPAAQFDTTVVDPTTAVGKLQWDPDFGMLQFGLEGGNVDLRVGQESVARVFNAEATTLQKGEVVYIFGAQGGNISVKRATNVNETASTKTFGIVAETITSTGTGFVATHGIVTNLNTSAFSAGDVLWLGSTAGTVTITKPSAPAHAVYVGIVLKTNNGGGSIFVKPQNGYELEELHNVSITSPTSGQVLKYNGTLWVNDTDDAGTTITSLDDIGNVVLSSPTSGQVLKFDGTNWINGTDDAGTSINSLDDIGDVTITSVASGEVLAYNGTNWINSTVTSYTNIDGGLASTDYTGVVAIDGGSA